MRDLPDGSYIFGADMANLLKNKGKVGLLDGCLVTKSGSVAMELDVAAGTIVEHRNHSWDNIITVASDTVTIPIETVLNIRFDLIYADTSGNVIRLAGNVESTAPELPADMVLLAIVGVEKDAVTLDTGLIFDARIYSFAVGEGVKAELIETDREGLHIGLDVDDYDTQTLGVGAEYVRDIGISVGATYFASVAILTNSANAEISISYRGHASSSNISVVFTNVGSVSTQFKFKIVRIRDPEVSL